MLSLTVAASNNCDRARTLTGFTAGALRRGSGIAGPSAAADLALFPGRARGATAVLEGPGFFSAAFFLPRSTAALLFFATPCTGGTAGRLPLVEEGAEDAAIADAASVRPRDAEYFVV